MTSRAAVEREGPGASLGRTLRRLRTQRGLSLERLSARCGVSRAMLSQIESGRSMPTITVLGRVAGGLKVPVAQLVDGERVRPVVATPRASAPWQTLGPLARLRSLSNDPRLERVRFFELDLDPGAELEMPCVAAGDVVNLVVDGGQVCVSSGPASMVELATGDALALCIERAPAVKALRHTALYVLATRPL